MLPSSKDAKLGSDTHSPEKDGDEILVSGSIAFTADTLSLLKQNGRKFGDFRGALLSTQTDQLKTIRKNSVRLNGDDILLWHELSKS